MAVGYDVFNYGHSFDPVRRSYSAEGTDANFSGDSVKAFEHCKSDANFTGGLAQELKVGEYDASNEWGTGPGLGGINNDEISALWVPEGYKVTLYEHSNTDDRFPGTTKEYVGPLAVHCLADDDWNDSASHIKVETLNGGGGGGGGGGGSNGGEEDFMFGMSKMTVGLVGAGALVGIYLLIS